MLLTITTTASPATDLGFLLHKHPGRVQEFSQSFGTARVFYPEAGEERCTAALLLEVDPIALVRSRGKGSPDFSLSQYVNDRPYAASSLLAVALGDVFRTARAGRCKARPELPGQALPLELRLPALPCRGGPDLARRLFEPLGWEVEAQPLPLDEGFPEWGESRYVRLTLRGAARLSDALNHLYVLLPVLDDGKHYWIAPDEVDKLIRAGEGWLRGHPERGLITRRYLGRRWALARTALTRLAELGDETEEQLEPAVAEDAPAEETAADELATAEAEAHATTTAPAASYAPADAPTAPYAPAATGVLAQDALIGGARVEGVSAPDAAAEVAGTEGSESKGKSLSVRRREAVLAKLEELGAVSVIDLGCGQGELVGALLARPRFARVAGMDVSSMALTIAARKLRLDRMPDAKRARLTLFQGALTYTDKRLKGYDAAVLMEVIEHVDPPRLTALERVVFGHAKPAHVLVTTPNIEHNVRYEFLTGLRHPDHRFEWTRAEFAAWATRVAAEHGYQVAFEPVGDDDPEVGPPTQMGVFTRDQRS
ncbi:3' terminal RNA ribose 2'-O-methyltransferase Hen1 [Nonomuraea turcica]|uniref:3' terminal RNA ribose 2'-O-methyltransferase Hen1 n=1 Tax=Nonomuraea sp. G32 TaxID=3067274 RepID=UPI00273AABE4|nr:3' terminal RNA ribose 2'-O-methyltransferase Hen1 [Nonomuraea sp. G32]MDP4508803.1 3' terminal RNA ribose 2'-O-methyltransferase Hen1 [Nonomuraea sp. G32]